MIHIQFKRKMNAASLIVECSEKRFNLLKINPQLFEPTI
jgi:hypothetical protein